MLKRALFAGAALVIGAMSLQGAVTPASAGPNVKPKVKIVPKPRIRVVKPKIRVRIDKTRLLNKKAPVLDPAASGVASTIPKPKIDATDQPPGFAANAERLAELAQIGAFKEHIEGILDMLAISGLDGTLRNPGLSDWGAGVGEDGNRNNIPGGDGQNNDGPGNRPGFDDPGRRAVGAGPDYSGVAAGLLGRVSGNLGSGEKMGGAVTTAPSPGDALGGIASQESTLPTSSDVRVTVHQGEWRTDPSTGNLSRRTVYGFSGGGQIVTNERIFYSGGRQDAHTVTVETVNGVIKTVSVSYPPSDVPEKGSGDAGAKIDPGEGITKQQDPDSGGGVVVWIPPGCGSAACNGIRDYLRDPQGEIRRIAGKGTRVQGDREGDPNTSTTRLVIDRNGLVVSYGADSGPAQSGGGRVGRLEKTRIVK